VRPEAFVVHYQPVLDLTSARAARLATGPALAHRTRWVEALLRWPLKDGSLLAPSDPGAPELHDRVIDSAVEIAVRHAMRWRARWMGFPVAVNLSARQLARRDLASHLADLVDGLGGRRGDLLLEGPAGQLVPGRDAAVRRAIGDLCEHGFRLALDEVTLTGGSVSALAGLPADVLKVSRRLVAAMPHDPAAAAAVAAQGAFARSAGMIALAVGIQTETQLDMLVDMGYRLGQGFLLSHPLTASEISVFCRPPVAGPAGIEAARRRLVATD
jgi:EAL domain-containing protein (putative c-di-GMP-specific phosphodiesterase class I)